MALVKKKNLPFPKSLLNTNTIKVLIVDDDEPVLDILAEGLKKADKCFAVETATDGFEAGQVMERQHPDVVILDIFLPGIDGYKVCSMIKEGHPDTKVIAITGYGSEEVEKKIMKAGADIYIEKPFDIKNITVQIQESISEVSASVG
jgi:DNA-binding response OmpR family regulator